MMSRPPRNLAASVRKANLDAQQVLSRKLAERIWSPDRLMQEVET
jgi:hypothetical protein